MAYVPGKDNVVGDALSRWAYPASQSFNDVSWHGSKEDDQAMGHIIEEEKKHEKANCAMVIVRKKQILKNEKTSCDDFCSNGPAGRGGGQTTNFGDNF